MTHSYHRDDCDTVTLDNWAPSEKVSAVPKSQWRQEQNKGDFNQHPGLDELRKINKYLKKGYPDHQIMESFGITSETLVAIKRECYSPVTGISLDNQSKIYKEFARIDKKLDRVFAAFKLLSDNVFDSKDTAKRLLFKTLISPPKKKNQHTTDEEE
jgi:hypothetical protein